MGLLGFSHGEELTSLGWRLTDNRERNVLQSIRSSSWGWSTIWDLGSGFRGPDASNMAGRNNTTLPNINH